MHNKQNELRKIIGDRIKKERIRTKNPASNGKHYSQDAFAELLGISKATYCNLENGIGEPKLEYLYKIKEECDCDISYLIGETDFRTRIATDIHAETGLSESSVEALRNESTISCMKFYDYFITESGSGINNLRSRIVPLVLSNAKVSIFKNCFSPKAIRIFLSAYNQAEEISFMDLFENYKKYLKRELERFDEKDFVEFYSSTIIGTREELIALNIAPDCIKYIQESENKISAFITCFVVPSFQYFEKVYKEIPAIEYRIQKEFLSIVNNAINHGERFSDSDMMRILDNGKQNKLHKER